MSDIEKAYGSYQKPEEPQFTHQVKSLSGVAGTIAVSDAPAVSWAMRDNRLVFEGGRFFVVESSNGVIRHIDVTEEVKKALR